MQSPAPTQEPVISQASGATFKLPGKREEVSAEVFQEAIVAYSLKAEEAGLSKHVVPLVASTKGPYMGLNIYKCYGGYRADEYCIKCPLRKNCITHKG